MPMETNAATPNVGIRPVGTPATPGTIAPQRTGEVRSPFAPETNVNIRNSVSDMTAVLSSVTEITGETAETMPSEVQNIVNDILHQAFSFKESLAKGIGSSVESQRFATEQLMTLSRIISQLSGLSRQSVVVSGVSDELAAFLNNLKGFMTDKDSALSPVLLHKLAYELLDNKSVSEISPEIMALLGQINDVAPTATNANTESFGFLKQLVQYFMPSASENAETASPQTGNAAANAEQETPLTDGDNNPLSSNDKTLSAESKKETGSELMKSADSPLSSERGGKTIDQPKQSEPATAPNEQLLKGESTATKPNAENSTATEQGVLKRPADNNQQSSEGNIKTPNGKTPGEQPSVEKSYTKDITGQKVYQKEEPVSELFNQSARSMAERRNQSQGETVRSSLPLYTQPEMENSPKTMAVMKELGELLVKDRNLSETDAKLLSDFVNGKNEFLTEKEAKQLQLLLRLCQRNLPAAVQQAAIQTNLPGLPRLWAFMQLCDVASLKLRDKSARQLKKISDNVADFAESMKEAMEGNNSISKNGQRSLNFMLPLYLTAENKTYPAYVSVYDEENQDNDDGKKGKETWLRICILTENIGAVELTCRVYEKNNLDVRLFFSQRSSVQEFKQFIPEFVESFENSSLELMGLKLGVVGART